MHSVASVCLSVCDALIFESLLFLLSVTDIHLVSEFGRRPLRSSTDRTLKGCLHYDTCTPYMYVVQVYGVHVS